MSTKRWMLAGVALIAALGAGMAQANGRDDVQWSVTIGTPIGTPVYTAPVPVYGQPVYTAPVYQAVPAYPAHRYQGPTRWDRDGDGVPNRYDRVYNPRWDRDGDGIPNRYDRVDNRRWDRDGDGIPNRYDHVDGRGRWGR